jgi:hypothetical protein
MHKKLLAACGLLALLATAPAIAQKTGAGATAGNKQATQNRMVFQINEDDSRKWHTVLANHQQRAGRTRQASRSRWSSSGRAWACSRPTR